MRRIDGSQFATMEEKLAKFDELVHKTNWNDVRVDATHGMSFQQLTTVNDFSTALLLDSQLPFQTHKFRFWWVFLCPEYCNTTSTCFLLQASATFLWKQTYCLSGLFANPGLFCVILGVFVPNFRLSVA